MDSDSVSDDAFIPEGARLYDVRVRIETTNTHQRYWSTFEVVVVGRVSTEAIWAAAEAEFQNRDSSRYAVIAYRDHFRRAR